MTKTRLKSMLVLAITALSLTTAGVATAAAAPEILNKEGKPLVKKTFTGTTEERIEFEGRSGIDFQCKSAAVTGEITGVNSGTGTMTLTGCNVGLLNCKSKKQKEGVMILPFTEKLVPTSETETGLDMLRSINQVISCNGEGEELISGGYLTSIGKEQTNKLKSEFYLDAEQGRGLQSPSEYYSAEKGGLVKETLQWEGSFGIGPEPLGVRMKETETFAEEAEFKS